MECRRRHEREVQTFSSPGRTTPWYIHYYLCPCCIQRFHRQGCRHCGVGGSKNLEFIASEIDFSKLFFVVFSNMNVGVTQRRYQIHQVGQHKECWSPIPWLAKWIWSSSQENMFFWNQTRRKGKGSNHSLGPLIGLAAFKALAIYTSHTRLTVHRSCLVQMQSARLNVHLWYNLSKQRATYIDSSALLGIEFPSKFCSLLSICFETVVG